MEEGYRTGRIYIACCKGWLVYVDTLSPSASRARIQTNHVRIRGPVYRDDLFASRLGVYSSLEYSRVPIHDKGTGFLGFVKMSRLFLEIFTSKKSGVDPAFFH